MSTEQQPENQQPGAGDQPNPADPALPDWFNKIPFDPNKGSRMEIIHDAVAAVRTDDDAEVRGPSESA